MYSAQGVLQSDRIAPVLNGYWRKRLAGVPGTLLSERARLRVLQARTGISPDSTGGAGFEYVEAALAGRPEGFWFLDLGAAAWIQVLHRLRREGQLGAEPDNTALDRVERIWRQYGPGHAVQAIDAEVRQVEGASGALSLYRVPLALWQEKNPRAAMMHLDRAIARLAPETIAAFGPTLPLTYGLLHALSGDVAHAAAILAEGRVSGRPTGWTGLTSSEVRYHRARYLWDLRQYAEAIEIVRGVLAHDASYLIRLATDVAWAEAGATHTGQLRSMVGEVIREARSALLRWQQGRRTGEETLPQTQRILELLDFAGDEPYLVLAASTLLPAVEAWRAEQAAVGHIFYADLDRLRAFARALPASLPLRLGHGFHARFVGEDSDIDHLEALVESGHLTDAAEYVDALLREVPLAVKAATISYGARLVSALATAIDILAARRRAEDEPRLEKLTRLSGKCLTLIEPIKALPDDVGRPLSTQLERLWEEVVEIEKDWVRSDSRAFGQLRLLTPPEPYAVRRGDWRAFAVKVVDAAGSPVAGVPVVWRVAVGPAHPKEPTDGLDNEWALSLQTGVAYLPVEVKGVGSAGHVEAWILGDSRRVRVPYRVDDRPRPVPSAE
ncbi:MAG TPA: hypothetical protein VF178_02255 [Gemmatimonadaceae bacterium]